jgi:hypothetical protein
MKRTFVGWLVVVITVLALVPVAGAGGHVRPSGPPQTLATQRQVSGDEVVTSAFPIGFLGVFYEGEDSGGHVRFRRDGRWDPWVELAEDGVEVDGQWASGLVPGSGAEAYQVRVPGSARGTRAVAINTTDGPTSSGGATSSTCADTTPMVTRCEWGADESLMTWGAPEFYPAQKLTVHHTATANGATDPAATVRAIYRYHAVDRGFGDIGYHFLVDEAGQSYEGRHSGDSGGPAHDAAGKVVTAAHVGGFNSGNVGIALLGTLSSVNPQPGARSALEQLLTNLSTRHGIDPQGSKLYVNPVSGVTKTVANIPGHRDWAATDCPGGNLYALLPAIRSAVAGVAPPDVTPPVISALTASPTTSGATISWLTNEPATSKVEYRRTKTTTWTAISSASLRTSHSLVIGGLARRTSYDYRATSVDGAGNAATSAVLGFKTR